MMQRAGFILAAASGAFSVMLLAWNGFHDFREDWVYGFLAAFWSVLMMVRLMTLTTPNPSVTGDGLLAQKILGRFHDRQEEDRQKILETAFGGSFALFLAAGFSLAAWLGICAAFSAQLPAVEGMTTLFGTFDHTISLQTVRFFDWGQVFMLFLTFAMMGFVIRSHAGDHRLARPLLIVVAGYAAAGLIFFSGLPGETGNFAALPAGFFGGGSGASSYLPVAMEPGKTLSFFEMILLEGGVVGLGILSFLLFIPLGYVSLSAQGAARDPISIGAGVLIGAVMILAAFLPFTKALGAFMALCWMGLFLAWGLCETASSESRS